MPSLSNYTLRIDIMEGNVSCTMRMPKLAELISQKMSSESIPDAYEKKK